MIVVAVVFAVTGSITTFEVWRCQREKIAFDWPEISLLGKSAQGICP
jgi:hypothetical protein